jgi:hypothetical protein
MTVYHLHCDPAGDSHLSPIDLHLLDATGQGAGRVRVLGHFPAYDVSIAETIDRLEDQGLHPPPRRLFLAILAGTYEIETTAGDKVCLDPGDCLFVDDAGGKGHWSRDVGDDPLVILSAGIPDDFVYPPARPTRHTLPD